MTSHKYSSSDEIYDTPNQMVFNQDINGCFAITALTTVNRDDEWITSTYQHWMLLVRTVTISLLVLQVCGTWKVSTTTNFNFHQLKHSPPWHLDQVLIGLNASLGSISSIYNFLIDFSDRWYRFLDHWFRGGHLSRAGYCSSGMYLRLVPRLVPSIIKLIHRHLVIIFYKKYKWLITSNISYKWWTYDTNTTFDEWDLSGLLNLDATCHLPRRLSRHSPRQFPCHSLRIFHLHQ